MGATKSKKKKKNEVIEVIRPQAGPQENFLASPADIIIFGGAAGSGKSYSLLLETLRHTPSVPEFGAVFFRRNTTQIRNPGGLWDESMKLYPLVGATPVKHNLEWYFPNGGKVKMAHLEYDHTVLDWQGSQIPLILFDELTHFTQNQFFYMLSRNRSMSGVKPYIRATCNPDADSWVAEFIAWWIDQETGFPIAERAGQLRWFVRVNDTLVWADTREELVAEHGETALPKSVTFIPALLSDNKKLMEADPGYLANLMALSRVERARLLHGNWKIRPAAGLYFKRDEVEIIDRWPDDVIKVVRRWDLAATEPHEGNLDPDWTAGVLMGLRRNGKIVVGHCERFRKKTSVVRERVRRTAEMDGYNTKIGLPQDPGQAGVDQVNSYISDLAGFAVEPIRETGNKIIRADPFAAQWQAGNVQVLKGYWNEAFFAEHEEFGGGTGHDDQVDASSGGYLMLAGSNLSVWAKLGGGQQ